MAITYRSLFAAGSMSARLLRHPGTVTTVPSALTGLARSNWDTGEPWWNIRAVRYLAERLPSAGTAFEWGSGGSTVWLSNRGLAVTAVESELDWADKVRARAPKATVRFIPGTASGDLRSEPQLRDHGEHFFDDYVAAIHEFEPESLDVVVVDGICRIHCARAARAKVKPGGVVIVDDTNWDFLSPVRSVFTGWEARTLSGFKPRTPEIFSTTFFHRPG
jgi:hypothetical protein